MSAIPDADLPSTGSDWGRARRLLPYLASDAWLYALALLCAPASAALVVAQPWLLKVAIDSYVLVGDAAGLESAALAFLGAVLAGFVLEAAHTLTISYAASRTIARLRLAVYRHTLGLAQSWFDRVPTGRLLTRATSDVDALGETLTAGAITIFLDVALVVGILVAMFWLDATLTLVLLLVAPPLALAIEGIRRVLRRLSLRMRVTLAELNAFLAERLAGVLVVQLYSDEERAIAMFDERLHRYRDATIRANLWDALLFALVDGLSSVTMALMLWYGSGSWLKGAVTAGLLAAFIDYIAKLFQPIREFSSKVAVIQRASGAIEKIFDLLDVDERVPDGDADVGELRGLVLDGVSFAYGEGQDVLREVSFAVEPGEVVALVGRTGSGKTTIGKLLVRAYGGYRGHIRVSGVELADIPGDRIRSLIGMVPQDVQLFPGTVRFNLAMGHPIDDARLLEAVEQVQAGDVVRRLGGLDGRVEHQGRNLSVGEAQLLAFARIMASDPPMVILDEATASVDSLTEAAIQRATDVLFEHKTVLVVAHRLSTIVGADRIVVLEGGRVLETGTHQALLARGGPYAQLFQKQFVDHDAA